MALRDSPYSPWGDDTRRYRVIDGTSSILFTFQAGSPAAARRYAQKELLRWQGWRGLGQLWLVNFDRTVDERI